MAANTPYVTAGDTPNCDACRSYYAERYCEDCDQNLCTWCNIDIHVPIGKRNHYRPRLYGVDEYAHLEGPAVSTADKAIHDAEAANAPPPQSTNKFTFDSTTGRVHVTTEHLLSCTPEEAWDLLGDWDAPFLPFSVDVNDENDRRVLSLPPSDDAPDSDPIIVTERLIQRDDREMFYSYSRLVPPAAGFPYTDLMSKFAFVAVTTSQADRQCVLQWTTSVLPNDSKNPQVAAEALAGQDK